MKRNTLLEEIAKIIYDYEGGWYPEEYEACVGSPKPLWGKWENEAYVPNQLTEHERDDYRLQASKVIEFLEKHKALKGIYKESKDELDNEEARTLYKSIIEHMASRGLPSGDLSEVEKLYKLVGK
jgi:hypothetical protein